MNQHDNSNSASAEDVLKAFLKELVLDPLISEQSAFFRKLNTEISTSIEANDSLLSVKSELEKLLTKLDELNKSLNNNVEEINSSRVDIINEINKYSITINKLQNTINVNKDRIEDIHIKVKSLESSISLNNNSTNKTLKILLNMQLVFIVVFLIYLLIS